MNIFQKFYQRKKTSQAYGIQIKFFFLKKILKKFNKQINILDISGAPGLDAIHLSKLKKIKSYDLTEFDKKFLKNYNELEIPNSKCFYLDFDKKIFFKSKKKYDLILFSGSIYYAKDLNLIANFLSTKLYDKGYLFIKSIRPDIGSVIRLGMINNPPYIFWSKKIIKHFFTKNKFLEIEAYNYKKFSQIDKYFSFYSTLKHTAFSIIGILSLFFNLFKLVNIFKYNSFFYGGDFHILFKKK